MSPKSKHRGTEATVARILDEALEVYVGRGPEAFTMKAVIAATGASSGSLYHHFGSFDGLCAALYARCMGRLLDSLLESLEPFTDPATDAHAGLEAVARAYLEFTREDRAAALFIHASAYASYLPAYAETIRAVKQPRMERLVDWMGPRMAAGTMATLSSIEVEMLLIGPVAEASRRWLCGDPAIDLGEVATTLPGRIWRSLAGSGQDD